MGWKNWPYWLKGGLIFEIVLLIQIILTYLCLITGFIHGDAANCLVFAISPGLLFTKIVDGIIIPIVVNLVVYFTIGTLIGFLFGKLKKKK